MNCAHYSIDLFGCIAALLSVVLVAGSLGVALVQLSIWIRVFFDGSTTRKRNL